MQGIHANVETSIWELFTDINSELPGSGLLVKRVSSWPGWEFGAFGTFFRHTTLQANYSTFVIQRWRSLDALSYHPGIWGLEVTIALLWILAAIILRNVKPQESLKEIKLSKFVGDSIIQKFWQASLGTSHRPVQLPWSRINQPEFTQRMKQAPRKALQHRNWQQTNSPSAFRLINASEALRCIPV